MNLITKNNYEAYLLDYLEGNLSPELSAELMLFFENNPEFKEDLEAFESITLIPSTEELVTKEDLKITENKIGLVNYEDAIISEIEGENTVEQSAALQAFLRKHPEKEKELTAYRNTKLKALPIIYKDKSALMQKESKVIPLYWWYASAAAVILALFLLNGINWNEEETQPIIADKTELTEPVKENVDKKESKEVELVVEDIADENLIATEQKKKKQLNNTSEKTDEAITNKKKKPLPIHEVIEEENISIAEVQAKDTLKTITPNLPENDNEVEEEVLYANNVKIVYEEDNVVAKEDSTTSSSSKKVRKFDVIRAAVKQQLKEKFSAKSNGEPALAFNAGPFNFGKNKNNKR